MRSHLAGVSLLLTLLASCSISIPLEGRPCPCDESRGFFCDESTQICVSNDGLRCGTPDAEVSPVEILDLRVGWRVDRAVEIRWTISTEDRQRLSHYELVIGTDREAVLTRGEGVTVYDSTSAEHPEFLRFALPIDGGDVVDRTVLRDLVPDATYFVSLVGVDDAGGVACPAPLEFRTWLEASHDLVIFDENPHDAAMPASIERIDRMVRPGPAGRRGMEDAMSP